MAISWGLFSMKACCVFPSLALTSLANYALTNIEKSHVVGRGKLLEWLENFLLLVLKVDRGSCRTDFELLYQLNHKLGSLSDLILRIGGQKVQDPGGRQ